MCVYLEALIQHSGRSVIVYLPLWHTVCTRVHVRAWAKVSVCRSEMNPPVKYLSFFLSTLCRKAVTQEWNSQQGEQGQESIVTHIDSLILHAVRLHMV